MSTRTPAGWLVWMVVLFLQLIATQVTTFVIAMIPPGFKTMQIDRPWLFALLAGAAFSAGAFLIGWLAISRGWLNLAPRYPARLVGSLIGAYAPLMLGVALFQVLQAGSPFFALSIFLSILGFHLPNWFRK